MEFVKLLLVLLGSLFVLLLVYLLILLITKKFRKDIKKEAILKCIQNDDESCFHCNGNCEKFAEGLLKGEKSLEDCPKLSKTKREELKNLLNIQVAPTDSKVAFVFCKGGSRAEDQYKYVGVETCSFSNKLFDGLKVCDKGCQGCMDCAKVCPTGAIYKNSYGVAEVNRALCIGCGECEKKCPDGIIKMIDLDTDVCAVCRQCDKMGETKEVEGFCYVGCTKCGACVDICPTGAFKIENGALKHDNSKCIKCYKCVYACPNNTINRIVTDFGKN